ncbi:MAG TPA: hypothetical protein VKV04_13450 [Verrucomicrobiae bacterium]|nr:hypothetical protein [Verrucomicrobiae bacterium]
MSQVNDALKRVRDTQQQGAPRSAEIQLMRPPMPAAAPEPARGVRLLMPIVFIAVALLGLSVFLQLRQKQPAQPPAANVKPTPAPEPMEVASVAKPEPELPALPPAAPKPNASASVAMVPAPTVAAPPPKLIKLQGILYAGHSSTAMISGQTVMAGDEVGGYRVAAIDQRSVTLVCAARTNVLSLGR